MCFSVNMTFIHRAFIVHCLGTYSVIPSYIRSPKCSGTGVIYILWTSRKYYRAAILEHSRKVISSLPLPNMLRAWKISTFHHHEVHFLRSEHIIISGASSGFRIMWTNRELKKNLVAIYQCVLIHVLHSDHTIVLSHTETLRGIRRAMSVLVRGDVRFPFSSTSSAWRTYEVAKSLPGATHLCLTPSCGLPHFPLCRI